MPVQSKISDMYITLFLQISFGNHKLMQHSSIFHQVHPSHPLHKFYQHILNSLTHCINLPQWLVDKHYPSSEHHRIMAKHLMHNGFIMVSYSSYYLHWSLQPYNSSIIDPIQKTIYNKIKQKYFSQLYHMDKQYNLKQGSYHHMLSIS